MKSWYYEIGTIVVIIIAEISFWLLTDPLSGLPFLQPTADMAVPIAKRSFIGPKCKNSILLFGDSSCMFGLKATIISDRLKSPCINFGTLSSFTIAGAESQIQEITSKYKPKAIVLAYIPRSFEITETKAREYKLLGRYLIAYNRKSNLYKPDFNDFRTLIFQKHQFNVFPPEFGGSYNAFSSTLTENQGYFPEFHKYVAKETVKKNFESTEFSEKALRAIDEIAFKLEIPLYMWISPSPKDAVDTEYIADVNTFLKRIESSSKKLVVIRDAPIWEPNMFATVTHVNDSGATINSEELAQCLLKKTRFDK